VKTRIRVREVRPAEADREPRRPPGARFGLAFEVEPPELAVEERDRTPLLADYEFVSIPLDPPPDGADVPLAGYEGGGEDALIEWVMDSVEPAALPDRPALEALFGASLEEVRVYAGPQVAAVLEMLGVQAAARGDAVLLPTLDVDPTTLAHELVHVLQTRTDGEVGPLDAVEEEAEALARHVAKRAEQDGGDFAPLPVEAGLPADLSAFQVAEPPVADTVAPPVEERAFGDAVNTAEAPPPEPRPAEIEPDIAPPEGESERTLEAAESDGETPADGDAETPTLETPAPPEPGITPEEVAAQQVAREEAAAALEAAEDVGGLVDHFAEAPPTLKAQYYDRLGGEVNRLSGEEEQAFQQDLPEISAELNAEVEPVEPLEVSTPEQREIALEDDPAPPVPEADLPDAPAPAPYTANDRVADRVQTLPEDGEARARQVGQTLNSVQTSDPDIDPSPGPPPEIPLEDATDPARITEQQTAGAEQARGARDEAHQAVLDGPGPEQVQPVALDEPYPLEEMAPPVIEPPAPVEGPDAYLAMELPPDVQAAFDADQQEAMQASLEEPRTEVQGAVDTRDQEREAAVGDAEAEAARLNEEADAEQRRQVQGARETIQTERQHTLDAQTQAVSDMEAEAETERSTSHADIEARVEQDQAEIRSQYQDAETEAQREVDSGEHEAEARRREAEREAEDRSWWDRAVDFVKSAFEALTSALNAIFDAVRAAVNRILDAVIALAERLIDLAADFIHNVIDAFAAVLHALVDTLLADLFPELAAALNEAINAAVAVAHEAVNQAAEALKAGVRAVVEGLRAALNAVLNAFQAAVQLAVNMVQAALTGDWAALARMAFEAILRVAGIDPAEIYAFIGRAQETLQIIVDDPMGFLSNALDALLEGIRMFAGNFLQHLQAGIIGWLTGALGSAGITLPERFDLMGVISLVLQILGLTWERLREKAVRLIGEENVQRLEFVASYIQTLIEGGWGALIDRIKGDLASLRDQVLEGIKSFLLERIVMAAITKLATMFNPVGAVVQLIITAYNLFTFLRDQLQRIIEVVRTIVDGIGDIARGIIEPAATRVEEVLARLLPIVIDLLARVLGLGNVSRRVQEIIERVQQAVDRAIDRLIERVLAMFRGRGGDGAADEEAPGEEDAADGEAAGEIGERLPINVPGEETHHIYVDVQGRDARLMVQSEPRTVKQLRRLWIRQAARLTPEANQERAQTLLGQLEDERNTADRAADAVAAGEQRPTGVDPLTALEQVVAAERDMVVLLRELFQLFAEQEGGQGAEQLLAELGGLLDRADPFAREDLLNQMLPEAEEYLRISGTLQNVYDRLSETQFLRKPLLATYQFGTAMRKALAPELEETFKLFPCDDPDQNVRCPKDIDDLITSRSGLIQREQEPIYNQHAPFQHSLGELRQMIFDRSRRQRALQTLALEYAESVERYLRGRARAPEHRLYYPVFLDGYDADSWPVVKYRYDEIDGPEFTVTHDESEQTVAIKGENLRYKVTEEQLYDPGTRKFPRGITERGAGNAELMLNASHLIADHFMGSGFRQARNLIDASTTYNNQEMGRAEREIRDFIKGISSPESGKRVTNVTFTLEVKARQVPLLDSNAIRAAKERFLPRILEEERAQFEQDWDDMLKKTAEHERGIKRIASMTYDLTVFVNRSKVDTHHIPLGPDLWLGLSREALRQLKVGGD
jgi:hypothetical protein